MTCNARRGSVVTFVFGLIGLVVFAPSLLRAELVQRDLAAPGDGLVTLDTDTGLEWLDLACTAGLSIDGARVSWGGLTGGRIATKDEVITLFVHAGVVDVGETSVENVAGVECLLDLLGATFTDPSGGVGALGLHDAGFLASGVAGKARLRIGPQVDALATADPVFDLVSTHAGFEDTGVFVVRSSAVDAPADGGRPSSLGLRAWPNPFNPALVVQFELPEPGGVSLVVHDLRGRRVRTLVEDAFDAGTHRMVWDGRGASGEDLASGTYFVRVVAAGHAEATRVVLVR